MKKDDVSVSIGEESRLGESGQREDIAAVGGLDPARIRKYVVKGEEDLMARVGTEGPVYVEWRGQRFGKGPVLWAVTNSWGQCLNKKHEWEHEPQPSSRTDAFIKRARWDDFNVAVAAALKAPRR